MSEQAISKAVVLLSGGLDSATILAMAQADGYTFYTIDPGDAVNDRAAELSGAELELVSLVARENRLRIAVDAYLEHRLANGEERLDYVIIDCPPSLSLLTVNAMVAAHSVLVPLQSEFFALEGLSQLMLSVRQVRSGPNPDLRIEGVVLTMYDRRNNLSQQVENDARETLGDLVFRTIVPRNVRLSEAPSFAVPVLEYDPLSKGSRAYRALAQEMVSRSKPATT